MPIIAIIIISVITLFGGGSAIVQYQKTHQKPGKVQISITPSPIVTPTPTPPLAEYTIDELKKASISDGELSSGNIVTVNGNKYKVIDTKNGKRAFLPFDGKTPIFVIPTAKPESKENTQNNQFECFISGKSVFTTRETCAELSKTSQAPVVTGGQNTDALLQKINEVDAAAKKQKQDYLNELQRKIDEMNKKIQEICVPYEQRDKEGLDCMNSVTQKYPGWNCLTYMRDMSYPLAGPFEPFNAECKVCYEKYPSDFSIEYDCTTYNFGLQKYKKEYNDTYYKT